LTFSDYHIVEKHKQGIIEFERPGLAIIEGFNFLGSWHIDGKRVFE
jgi:hypothetical protein